MKFRTFVRRIVESIAGHLPTPRVIYDRGGKVPYLSRYYLIGGARSADGGPAFTPHGNPREGTTFTDGVQVYLHRFHRSDWDGALHNHPWQWSASLILAGGYFEERRVDGKVERRKVGPFSLNVIRADDFHRVDLIEHDSWSLFIAGPRAQGWGFWDRITENFVPWREYLNSIRGEA